MKPLQELVRPNIWSLSPYTSARDEYQGKEAKVFLDANENPYNTPFNRYPDPLQRDLKTKIAVIKGVSEQSIFFGNGSDEAIDLMFRIFCTPGKDNAVAIVPSYGMYAVAADINDIQVRGVRLGPDFSLPVEALLAAADANTKLLFLCSPNNPSGNAFEPAQLLDLVQRFPGIVVLDEAYADFCAKGSLRSKVLDYPNLVVLQTFSKAYGMAGLRLGLAFANTYVTDLMNRVKYPYNISQAAQEAAFRALEEPMQDKVAEIVAQRSRLSLLLPSFPFVKKVWPSDANFLLVQVEDPDRLYKHLLDDGIIVRNRSRQPLCAGCLRITVGTPCENDNLLQSLSRYE